MNGNKIPLPHGKVDQPMKSLVGIAVFLNVLIIACGFYLLCGYELRRWPGVILFLIGGVLNLVLVIAYKEGD